MLEGFHLFQAAHVRSCCCQVRLGLGVGIGALIRFLLGDSVHLLKIFPTFGRAFCNLHLGRSLIASRAGLHKFLIDFGTLNIGEAITLLYAAANVLVPLQQVAIGASVDWRLGISLQGRRQHQFLLRRLGFRMNYRNCGDRESLGFLR